MWNLYASHMCSVAWIAAFLMGYMFISLGFLICSQYHLFWFKLKCELLIKERVTLVNTNIDSRFGYNLQVYICEYIFHHEHASGQND